VGGSILNRGWHFFLKQLQNDAIQLGATAAKLIPISSVVIDERVRLKCLVPLCGKYNQNLMCPPNLPPVEEFRKSIKNIPRPCSFNYPWKRKKTSPRQRLEDRDSDSTESFMNWRERHSLQVFH
jgi:predicted metal-binding protein